MSDLRRLAWLIAAAALVPLLMYWIIEAGFKAQEERRTIEANALAISEALQFRIDGVIERHLTDLALLATVTSLQSGDLTAFRYRAAEFIAINPGWLAVSVVDARSGAPLADVGTGSRTVSLVPSAVGRNAPYLAGYARGSGCPCLVFTHSAISAGRPETVKLFISNREITRMLPPAGKDYTVSAVVDPEGRFVARSLDGDRRFGPLASTYLRVALRSPAISGIYRGMTLEGVKNFTAYRRSPQTGWSTHVALKAHHIDDPARRFFASLGIAALLSLALAGILVWFALRQIAERKRIGERMEQSQKLEALGQLTGGIAHDFNNLLTPVLGVLDFVAKKPETDAASRRLLLGALGSARRAGKLTAQLLAFSRRQRLKIEPIDIAAVLDEIADLFRQSIGNSHRLEIAPSDPSLCAMGDMTQIELAILNIMINARDASPPGSIISITVTGTGEPTSGEVAIAIADQGSGMDEVTRRRAIEPFFTTKGVGHGTGLGLAQAFGMAEQSGGRLEIASAPGTGTIVTIVLRRCEQAAARGDFARAEQALELRSLRLLVIDDDPAVRAAIVRPLEEEGHVVDAVSDGPTALAALGQRGFDLVLVDFAMPGMDGAEFIRRARKVRKDSRFLIVSGYLDSDAISAAAPGTPVLAKPFDTDTLLALIGQLTS
jgi:signal transduction histidine kinase/CheY-like chemotaxis protein